VVFCMCDVGDFGGGEGLDVGVVCCCDCGDEEEDVHWVCALVRVCKREGL